MYVEGLEHGLTTQLYQLAYFLRQMAATTIRLLSASPRRRVLWWDRIVAARNSAGGGEPGRALVRSTVAAFALGRVVDAGAMRRRGHPVVRPVAYAQGRGVP